MLLPLKSAVGVDRLNLAIGQLSAPSWHAQQLSFTLDWDQPSQAGYRLEIGRLELPSLQQTFDGVTIDCRQGRIDDRFISCESGEARLTHPLLERPDLGLTFELDRVSGRLSGELKGLGIAGGSLTLGFQLEAGAWEVHARGKGLKLESMAKYWPPAQNRIRAWNLAARVSLDARLSGRDEALRSARWQADLSQLSLADETGLYAADGLAARLTGGLTGSGKGWRIDGGLALHAGELLTPVCYLNAATHPLKLTGELSLDGGFTRLTVKDLKVHLQDLIDLVLQGELRYPAEGPLQRLSLQAAPFRVGEVYRELLQPVLAGTPWGRFEMAGTASLDMRMEGDSMHLDLGLDDFDLDDTPLDNAPRRIGLYGVNGELYWNRGETPPPSHIEWQSGHLLEHIDIGPGRIDFQASDQRFRLTRQARIPLLDGTLVVDRLDVEAPGQAAQKLHFDGLIEPVSMAALSRALDWVPLTGKLSGMLPGLTYENGLFSVEGILLVRIFDGDILIKQLKSRDLFGVYPQLQADVELHGLDLESLTNTFSFGRITGRLDGYIHQLRLEDWQPVAFDARFQTPEGDSSRHRISQKAVDNISNLGGAGLSGSLARSFLGFFEEFRYQRIGIGCRLKDGICDMTGAGKAKQGYYLVEGSGIPRIDIIGYNRTADWSRLVEQLKQITTSGAPVIE